MGNSGYYTTTHLYNRGRYRRILTSVSIWFRCQYGSRQITTGTDKIYIYKTPSFHVCDKRHNGDVSFVVFLFFLLITGFLF